MWEKWKEDGFSQWNEDIPINDTPLREEKRTKTTAQREGITVQINCDTPTTQRTEA